jgi:hypothetical protein
MTKLFKEKTIQNDALPRSTILCLFPGREEGGLQNAKRKPVYHRRPPILSRFSEPQSSALREQRFLKEQ